MKSDHDRARDIGEWKTWVLYASTLVTFCLTLNEKYKLSETHKELKDYVDVAIGFNALFIIFYIVLELREGYLFARAERDRVFRYIDNSFHTAFAEKTIDNYFSQDYLNPGFYKLCVNCFENTFFTYNVAKQMQVGIYIKALFIVGVFMFSASVGDKGMARYIIESILPLVFVQSALKLSLFVSNLDNLRESFASFFTSIKDSDFSKKEPEALKNVITYEKILASSSIQTDSKIFSKLNPSLTKEWEEMKIKYNIKQPQ